MRMPPHEKHAEEPWREFRPDTHNLRNFGIILGMDKCFNIAGPCLPDEHYMLPALERLPGIMRIVEQRSYFVLHAARQSGKTTALMAYWDRCKGE